MTKIIPNCMFVKDNSDKYNLLRKNYSYFVFENFEIKNNDSSLIVNYNFNLDNKFKFNHIIKFPKRDIISNIVSNEEELSSLFFHLGMIELISYWKAACPPKLIIKPYKLTTEQITWWKKLYYKGLGEFFHTNKISPDYNEFISIYSIGSQKPDKLLIKPQDKTIVPVGGGKDSVVTLEILKNAGIEIIQMLINPLKSQQETIKNAGLASENCVIIKRYIDSLLLKLNDKGFLNGHIPFSAVVAFIGLISSYITKSKYIALSNESSANEPTIPDTSINHQYSKSYEFEKDFRNYVQEYICDNIEYFSFLRPLNELQIAKIFSIFKKHFSSFRSCNVGSKKNKWCGECSKCLFTYIILSPFVSKKELADIFNKNMLDDINLKNTFDQLIGLTKEKPFECVGTKNEINAALSKLIFNNDNKLPYLLSYYKNTSNKQYIDNLEQLLNDYDEKNFLPTKFKNLLRNTIKW